MDLDSDVAMSDASDLEPLLIPTYSFHTRLPSNASYASSATSGSPTHSREWPGLVLTFSTYSIAYTPLPAYYPSFDLYPTDCDSDMGIAAHGLPDPTYNAPQKSIGLMQPKNNEFSHHG